MVTSKSARSKTAAPKAKEAGQPAKAKASAPRGIPAPSIKPAAVVVPKISVMETPAMSDAEASAPTMSASGDRVTPLKKQELVERIVKASGAKKKDVKLIIEAALGVLGDALSAGEELNLPPLGKMKVNRQRQEGNSEILILKLRRGGGQGGGGKVFDAGAAARNDDGDDDGDDA